MKTYEDGIIIITSMTTDPITARHTEVFPGSEISIMGSVR